MNNIVCSFFIFFEYFFILPKQVDCMIATIADTKKLITKYIANPLIFPFKTSHIKINPNKKKIESKIEPAILFFRPIILDILPAKRLKIKVAAKLGTKVK